MVEVKADDGQGGTAADGTRPLACRKLISPAPDNLITPLTSCKQAVRRGPARRLFIVYVSWCLRLSY
jgi:hypothetical protein